MKIKNFIKATWELPQNVVGAIVKKIVKATPLPYYANYKGANVYSWNISGGISLGNYIFVPFAYNGVGYMDIYDYPRSVAYVENFIKHEYGHTVQSKYLGWLYLLVIALPSLIWAGCFEGYRQKNNVSYYEFYTEKWADKLGGVERSKNG